MKAITCNKAIRLIVLLCICLFSTHCREKWLVEKFLAPQWIECEYGESSVEFTWAPVENAVEYALYVGPWGNITDDRWRIGTTKETRYTVAYKDINIKNPCFGVCTIDRRGNMSPARKLPIGD